MMSKYPSIPLLLVSLLLLLLLSLFSFSTSTMVATAAEPADPEAATPQIVYVARPDGDADPEDFHISTLASVLGSKEAAKDAMIYHYTLSASGFAARLTPKQVEELKKQPGVLHVIPSRTYHLLGSSKGHGV
ncbi:Subtilisin-like protease SBT3.3 [Ananas comosus]|uniref:Subtilisin-like protease SBT3.3 n=1 Tax=Ananas comosus TaxID=4615 RepID=A0A199V2K0_ANACO|nr:Subtilisin-like protease SBT3.3 [Ananas comosus]